MSSLLKIQYYALNRFQLTASKYFEFQLTCNDFCHKRAFTNKLSQALVITLADKLAEVEAETLGDTVGGMEERGCPFLEFSRQVSGET